MQALAITTDTSFQALFEVGKKLQHADARVILLVVDKDCEDIIMQMSAKRIIDLMKKHRFPRINIQNIKITDFVVQVVRGLMSESIALNNVDVSEYIKLSNNLQQRFSIHLLVLGEIIGPNPNQRKLIRDINSDTIHLRNRGIATNIIHPFMHLVNFDFSELEDEPCDFFTVVRLFNGIGHLENLEIFSIFSYHGTGLVLPKMKSDKMETTTTITITFAEATKYSSRLFLTKAQPNKTAAIEISVKGNFDFRTVLNWNFHSDGVFCAANPIRIFYEQFVVGDVDSEF